MKIQRGRVVTMHYTLRDETGSTIESSRGRDPMVYLHGYGQLIPGLEKVLDGNEAGRATTVTVAPKDAYGERDANAVVRAGRDAFPEGMDITPGAEVAADTPDGPLSFVVVGIEGDEIVLDANHPMAGRTLTFDVEVTDVRAATPEEISHGHVHGPDGHGH
jgi:FKBP-type peptidyl-prolyl cis-trans isomerase SlyD